MAGLPPASLLRGRGGGDGCACGRDNQDDHSGNDSDDHVGKDHRHKALKAQRFDHNNHQTPQNRRQPLDRPILGTFPAWNSACVRGPGQRFSLRLTRVGSLLGMRGEDTLAAINRVRGSCRQMANTSRIPLTFAPEATLKLEGFDVSRFPGTASQIFMPG